MRSLPKNETQIQQFETQIIKHASLAHQNQSQFNELSHSNLSIINKSQIAFLISTKKLNALNTSRAQLKNNQKSFFDQFQSQIQSVETSINSTHTSSKMSRQVSAMKGKSSPRTTTRTSPRVSLTDDTVLYMTHQMPSNSNLCTPLTKSSQVLSFDKAIGKVFNENLIASIKSKDAVLKEVRACILRSDEERLKQLNPYLHSYCRDIHVISGCVRMDEKVAIPNALKDALIKNLHASQPGCWEMVCMGQHCWWPYMNSDLLVRAIECKPCTAIGKNLQALLTMKKTMKLFFSKF